MDEITGENLQNEQKELPKNATKQDKLLDILLRNPEGISKKHLSEKLNISESAVFSTVRRLRKKKLSDYKIITSNNLFIIKVKNNSPNKNDVLYNIKNKPITISQIDSTEKRLSRKEVLKKAKKRNLSILNLLKISPEGIHPKNIYNELNLKSNELTNSIYFLRNKGYNILYSDYKYKLINEPKNDNTKNTIVVQNAPNKLQFNDTLIPPEYIQSFNNLQDSDKIDCIDMLKKSLYYRKSAIALIESNQIAFSFCKNLINKGQ